MNWDDPGEVADRIAAMAPLAGCSVASVDRIVGAVELICTSQEAVVSVWNGLAELCAGDPVVATLALELRGHAGPDDTAFAALVLAWVQRNIAWKREPGERFTVARGTLRSRVGDCDCSALLVTALLLAGGVTARLVAMRGSSGALVHGVAQALLRNAWVWADASIKARLGTDARDVGRLPS